jgi:hypothetical protein
MMRAEGMALSVRNHKTAAAALFDNTDDHSLNEVSLYRVFHYGGTVLRRGRIDRVTGGTAIVDLKTTDDARPDSFSKTILQYGYHIQGAYYLDLWNDTCPEHKKEQFVIVAVESEAPFACAVYELDNEAIQKGRGEYIDVIAQYIECVRTGDWPAYTQELQKISLPKWALRHRGGFNWAS